MGMRVKDSYRREGYGTRRDYPSRADLSWSDRHTSIRRRSTATADRDTAVDNEAQAVASKIASMADRDVRQRYHELVDKRLGSELTALERFELEWIEARLDAEDRDPQIEARDRQWEMERTELLQSIEDLLLKLRS